MNTAPILLLIFNRPKTTKQVFESIRIQKPKYLFIAADGPREDRADEIEKCKEVRDLVLNNIDWDCNVKTLLRDNNLGCGLGVVEAINWLFEHVESGIILEDDCLPDNSFFNYCSVLLEKYKSDEKIFCINGTSFVNDGSSDSYYFSKHFDPWGWATWKRAWKYNDYELKNWKDFKSQNQIKGIDSRSAFKKFWYPIFDYLFVTKNKSIWDYQWIFACWYNKGLIIKPNVNLISNIGFHPEAATHTTELFSILGNRETFNIGEIKHPTTIGEVNESIERNFLEKRYYIRSRWKSYYLKLLNLK